MEILLLIQLAQSGKPVFVDTNIAPDVLHEISDERHVAILLSPRETSVDRFFDRPDPEKQFLLDQIRRAEDPERTMANFRACLARIHGPDHRAELENSGFFLLHRDDARTPEETVQLLAEHFGLAGELPSL